MKCTICVCVCVCVVYVCVCVCVLCEHLCECVVCVCASIQLTQCMRGCQGPENLPLHNIMVPVRKINSLHMMSGSTVNVNMICLSACIGLLRIRRVLLSVLTMFLRLRVIKVPPYCGD